MERLKNINATAAFARLYDAAFSWPTTDEIRSLEEIWLEGFGGLPVTAYDVGAGTGRLTIPLLKKGIQCVAIEPDEAMAEVMRQKVGTLPDELQSKFILVDSRFEDFETDREFDTCIFMTDTVSYVWPHRRLERFIVNARKCLRPDGIAIADIALWGRYPNESREESWTFLHETMQMTARYNATIISLDLGLGVRDEMVRLEELSFDGASDSFRLCISHERILHAFRATEFCALWQKSDFELFRCFVPGTRNAVDLLDGAHKRLLVAFRAC